MSYWIVLKRGRKPRVFPVPSAEAAILAVEAKTHEGWQEVRIVDPDGAVACAFYLRVALDSVEVQNV